MRQMLSFFWLFFLLTFHCAHAQEVNDLMRHLRTQALQVKRSEEHTSELQSPMWKDVISYAVFCL
jgi:hypothetical protein